jgi:hypothetical protein
MLSVFIFFLGNAMLKLWCIISKKFYLRLAERKGSLIPPLFFPEREA